LKAEHLQKITKHLLYKHWNAPRLGPWGFFSNSKCPKIAIDACQHSNNK